MADATMVPVDAVFGGGSPARPVNIGGAYGSVSAQERGSGSRSARDYVPHAKKGLVGLWEKVFSRDSAPVTDPVLAAKEAKAARIREYLKKPNKVDGDPTEAARSKRASLLQSDRGQEGNEGGRVADDYLGGRFKDYTPTWNPTFPKFHKAKLSLIKAWNKSSPVLGKAMKLATPAVMGVALASSAANQGEVAPAEAPQANQGAALIEILNGTTDRIVETSRAVAQGAQDIVSTSGRVSAQLGDQWNAAVERLPEMAVDYAAENIESPGPAMSARIDGALAGDLTDMHYVAIAMTHGRVNVSGDADISRYAGHTIFKELYEQHGDLHAGVHMAYAMYHSAQTQDQRDAAMELALDIEAQSGGQAAVETVWKTFYTDLDTRTAQPAAASLTPTASL